MRWICQIPLNACTEFNTTREHVSILKTLLKYDCNSSEAREAKSCGYLLLITYKRAKESFKKHSSQVNLSVVSWCGLVFMILSKSEC